MKNIRASWLLVNICSGLMLTVAGCESTHAAKKSFVIRSEQILGEWEGLSPDGIFYIMDLQPNASGKFGFISQDGKPAVLKIANWQCTDGQLLVSFVETNENPDLVRTVKGRAGWQSMSLNVSGAGWERPVVMYRETILERQRNALKPSMAE